MCYSFCPLGRSTRAEDRISTSFARFKKKLNEQNSHTKVLIKALSAGLQEAGYHAYYFSMSGLSPYCTVEGKMSCQGAWYEEKCPRRSAVYPFRHYVQRDDLSKWNFEHTITVKSIAAFIVEWSKKMPEGKKFCWSYFYQLMFHPPYVKFVEAGCHPTSEKGRKGVDYELAVIDSSLAVYFDVRGHVKAS